MTAAAIDQFLALCVRQSARAEGLPPWPTDWSEGELDLCQTVFDRIAFHGIALLIAQQSGPFATWPNAVRDLIQAEARAQSFWELGHREALARVLEALSAANMPSAVTKGSATAYTLYGEPALRRRGDSDVLIPGADRRAVGRTLSAIGMRRIGDARPLQESWAVTCAMGFTHVFDLHWRGNASAVISQCYDRAGIGSRTIPLPRVSPSARAIAPTDNLIIIAINRALHGQFGYVSGAEKAYEGDRLIWAMDLDLLCATFAEADWQALITVAEASGTAPVVASALDFAAAVMGTPIPTSVLAQLTAHPGDARLLRYLGVMGGADRLLLDLSATPTLTEKLRLIRYTLFPGTEVLHERFPEARHWPLLTLQLRRLLGGAGKLLRGHG